MYACLAVTCHLHFWQNDRDFLRATAVTRGWNGYRNKSQLRKSTLEKKILPPFQQGFEPATFQSRVRRSNHWAIPAPKKQEWTSESICRGVGRGSWGKQVGSMDEEPQVRGCYNITFICTPTNQETVSVLEKTQTNKTFRTWKQMVKYKQQQSSNNYSNHVVYL